MLLALAGPLLVVAVLVLAGAAGIGLAVLVGRVLRQKRPPE
jgi:hypothetical protein